MSRNPIPAARKFIPRSWVVAAAVAVVSGGPVAAQTIDFPSRSAADQAVPIRVTHLVPGRAVVVRTVVTDASGQPWVARARFRADDDGTVDTSRDPAIAGSYTGVETAGLLNHAAAVGDSAGRLRFQTAGTAPLTLTIAVADADGAALDSLQVERFFLAPGVTTRAISDSGLAAHLFWPARDPAPGIVVLGGSEGGYPDEVAALLAAHGFAALSLAYFGADSLPAQLAGIPLDRMARAVDWLAARPGLRSGRVALFGTSKGAEAALLVAARIPRIAAVVAYAPSSVAWSCICDDPGRASWTDAGKPLPSVPPGADPRYHPATGEALRPAVNYRYRLRTAPADAMIAVERISGPVLLVAGGDDQLWPSLPMARTIMERRAPLRVHRDDLLLEYPGAGHLIGKAFLPAGSTRVAGSHVETGGTPAENARAQADAWPQVLDFLARALQR